MDGIEAHSQEEKRGRSSKRRKRRCQGRRGDELITQIWRDSSGQHLRRIFLSGDDPIPHVPKPNTEMKWDILVPLPNQTLPKS
jgi:hypothetical protein